MNIEKVKWTWADAVQSKNVYRDDEFIRSKTQEESLEAIDFLMKKSSGMTYSITVRRDGEYFTYWRHSMPCLGGLVKYRDSHGSRYFMNPYFPRDIRVAFPEGDIIYIAKCRPTSTDLPKSSPYYEFIFSEESPWVSAFGDKDTIIFKDNYFVLTNMNTDPTVFYSLMRLGGLSHHAIYSSSRKWNPRAELLARTMGQADPRRIAGRKPVRISGGTWAEGYGYTRPYNESIFKTKLPNKLADFGKLAGYPQAPFDTTYFINEMKNVFKTDVSKGTNSDQKVEDALVEAWTYFKDKATELGDD